MLTLSSNRKTTPATKMVKAGLVPNLNNAFSLPSIKTCPGATFGEGGCADVCYAAKFEYIYPAMGRLVQRNYEALVNATFDEMVTLLGNLILAFRKDLARVTKKQAEPDKVFRIHADGDFFSEEYAQAWAQVIRTNPDITFWAYTRSFTEQVNVIPHLLGIDNLSLYLSADPVNLRLADTVYNKYADQGLKIAVMSRTFDEAQEVAVEITGDRQAKCPEGWKIPMITEQGGACVTCGLCIKGKRNLLFSVTNK